MEVNKLGKPLFVRTYYYEDGRDLIIRIWKPKPSRVMLFCWFQIECGSIHRVPGTDPLDAFIRALNTIEMIITRMRSNGEKIKWPSALEDGDIGLPKFSYKED